MAVSPESNPEQQVESAKDYYCFEIVSGATVTAGSAVALWLMAEADQKGIDLYAIAGFLAVVGLATIIDGVRQWRAGRERGAA